MLWECLVMFSWLKIFSTCYFLWVRIKIFYEMSMKRKKNSAIFKIQLPIDWLKSYFVLMGLRLRSLPEMYEVMVHFQFGDWKAKIGAWLVLLYTNYNKMKQEYSSQYVTRAPYLFIKSFLLWLLVTSILWWGFQPLTQLIARTHTHTHNGHEVFLWYKKLHKIFIL